MAAPEPEASEEERRPTGTRGSGRGRAANDPRIQRLQDATHSFFYSPLACAVVGRPHTAIAQLRARMGGAKWDHIVATYAAAIQEHFPNILRAKTAEIHALIGPHPHVEQETQNVLFRLVSDEADYSPNPSTGQVDFDCNAFIFEVFGIRHTFNGA